MSNVSGPAFDTRVLRASMSAEHLMGEAAAFRQAIVGQENFLGDLVSKQEGRIWT